MSWGYLQERRPAQEESAGCGVRFIYLTSVAGCRQPAKLRQGVESGSPRIAATIINGMRPQSIGRAMGIGFRLAVRSAGKQIMGSAQQAVSAPQPVAAPTIQGRTAGRTAGQASRGVAKGVGGFLRPFRRVGGIIWLEVTGVFFLLPVIVFGPTVWRTRASYAHGPDHSTFLISAGVVLVFLYLGVSSFWRARRR